MDIDRLVFILKTSFNCDMRCSYCYEGHRQDNTKMSKETLHSLISKIGNHSINTGSSVSFIWHGGEPLLAGLDFYKLVVAEQEALGSNFQYTNFIQTNGILLDGTYADFFVENNFKVGISIDGPPIIHDAQRFGVNAKTGTFKQVYSAFVEMDNRGMRPGALTVFTRNTLEHLSEFYEFFRDRSLSFKIIPLTFDGRAKDEAVANLQITPKEYGEALVYLFDRWINEPRYTFSIEPLGNFVRSIVSGNTYNCSQEGKCFNYFKIFPDGNVHLCGRQPYAEHTLGNINHVDLSAIINSQELKQYIQIKAAMKEICGKCEYFNICKGGCTNSAYSRYQKMPARDYYCESLKKIFGHIKPIVLDNISLCKSLSQETTLL